MKGLIKILASVMIIMSSCINSAQAQFVGTFWILPLSEDFPVGTKVVRLNQISGRNMLSLDLSDNNWKSKIESDNLVLIVDGHQVKLKFKDMVWADGKCCIYEAREGDNRVHVLFCRPYGQPYQKNSPLNKVIYTYYDIPPTPNPEGDMLQAAHLQGIGN